MATRQPGCVSGWAVTQMDKLYPFCCRYWYRLYRLQVELMNSFFSYVVFSIYWGISRPLEFESVCKMVLDPNWC